MNKEGKQLKPYQGLFVFFLVIIMLLFIATPIQSRLGMYGVVLTEVIILLFGIIPAIILKADLREIIPIKKPRLRQIFGVGLMWFGSYMMVTLVTLILGFFFPEGLTEVSSSLQETFTSIPMGIAFLIIAVSPAICEEVLVRGFILSSFYTLKNRWLIILIMGVIFGIFHLDPYRFLPTAILGMILTYIMIETKNILLPALFHFINNGFTTIISFLTPIPTDGAQIDIVVPRVSIGAFFILCAGVPFLLLWGAKLLHSKEQVMDEEVAANKRKRMWKQIWITTACTVVMFITGFTITITALADSFKPVLQKNITENINQDTRDMVLKFSIEKSGKYIMNFEIKNERGLIDMKMLDDGGNVVFQTSCMKMTSSNNDMQLEPGDYTIVIDFVLSEIEEYYKNKGYAYEENVKEQFKLNGDLSTTTPFTFDIEIREQPIM